MFHVIAMLLFFNNIYYTNSAVLPLSDNDRYPLSYICINTDTAEDMTNIYGNCFPHTRRILRYPVYDYTINISDNSTIMIEATPIIPDDITVKLPRFLCQPEQRTTNVTITLKCNSTDNNRIIRLYCNSEYEHVICDISLNT
jgi:hypothetical protein